MTMMRISRIGDGPVSQDPRIDVDGCKQVVIEGAYKQVYAHARLLNLTNPQAVFRGISDIAIDGDAFGIPRVVNAELTFDLTYATPAGPARMKLAVDYLTGRFAVSDAVSATAGESYVSLGPPAEIDPAEVRKQFDNLPPATNDNDETRSHMVEAIKENMPKIVRILKRAFPGVKPARSAYSAVIDAADVRHIRAIYNAMINNRVAAKIKTAQLMEYGRPMQPLAYLAERIVRLTEKMAGREPQAIYKDFVMTYPYMTDEMAEELADKVRSLGLHVEPIKVGTKNDLFSTPAEMMMQQDKYKGDDMNAEKFTERYHKNSPEHKPQEIDTAGRERPKPQGIFAQQTSDIICDACKIGEMVETETSSRGWTQYACDNCGHETLQKPSKQVSKLRSYSNIEDDEDDNDGE